MDPDGKSIPGTSRGSSFELCMEPPEKKIKIFSEPDVHCIKKMSDESSYSGSEDHDNHYGGDSDSDCNYGSVESPEEKKPSILYPAPFTLLCVPDIPDLNSPKPTDFVSSEPSTDPLTLTSECNNNPLPNSSKIHPIEDHRLKIKPESNSPIDYFSLLFTHQFLQEVVDKTNKFAKQPHSNVSNWKELNLDEFKIFLGLFLHTGIIKILHIRHYWDKSELFNFPFFANRMSRNRFTSILQSLNFTEDPAEGEPVPKDPVYKIGSIVQHFHNRMAEIYKSETDINLNDPVMAWKGRIYFRSYVPNKTHKHGIKLHILAENDGLIHRLVIRPGTENNAVRGHSDTSEVDHVLVGDLDSSEPPFMDSFCDGVPRTSKMLQEITKMDNLKHMSVSKMTIRRRAEREKSDGVLHNRIGAIDQLLSYYLHSRKSMKWYTKLWFDILELMLLNCYLLHKRYSGQYPLYLFKFRLELVKSLSGPGIRNLTYTRIPATPSFINSLHFPAVQPYEEKKRRRIQKLCKVCNENKKKKYVSIFCPACEGKPGLCIGCFIQYHRQREFKII